MRLLAWDTSSKAGALAAVEWDPASNAGRDGVRLVSEWALDVDATHSERLLWGINEILEAARWKLSDVDVFGVGVGPGSFTGLQIGVTTARTLAHQLGKPLVGVSSLAALARPAALWLADPKKRVVLIAATDACKGELFSLVGSARSITDCASMADGDRPGLWKRGVEETVLRPEELMKLIKRKLAEGGRDTARGAQWVAVGEGRHRYANFWKELPAARHLEIPAPFPDQIQGRFVAQLAWEAYQAGLGREALDVHPRYVRASDAEIKLKAGKL